MNGVRLTGHSAAQALMAFLGDARDVLLERPLLLVVLVALGIVVFGVTRPRVR